MPEARDEQSEFRGFVALPLPEPMRAQAATVVEQLRGDEVRWTATENLHMTLKFLGQVPPAALSELVARLSEVARAAAPFGFSVAGLGAFPRLERPQVIWLRVTEGAGALEALAGGVETACAHVGFAPEKRPFRAHITLGRVRAERAGSGTAGLSQRLRAAGTVALGQARAERFHLMKSDLTPRGPVYTVMATFDLGSDQASDLGKEQPVG